MLLICSVASENVIIKVAMIKMNGKSYNIILNTIEGLVLQDYEVGKLEFCIDWRFMIRCWIIAVQADLVIRNINQIRKTVEIAL